MIDHGPDNGEGGPPSASASRAKELPLFVFGTLRDRAVLRALFGREPRIRSAVLGGHRTCIAPDGYLCLLSDAGSEVDGSLLDLSIEELRVADQWEEVPLYARRRCHVRTGSGVEEAFYYERTLEAPDPAPTGMTSAHPEEDVVALADSLRRQAEAHQVPFCDLYILLPCCLEAGVSPEPGPQPTGTEALYLQLMSATSSSEFSSRIATDLKRMRLPSQEMVVLGCPGDEGEIGRQRTSVYLTSHQPTGLGVVTLMIPGAAASPLHLLDQMARSNLQVDEPGGPRLRSSLQDWLARHRIRLMGTPRAALFLSERPKDPDMLAQMLAAEAESPAVIVGEGFRNAALRSIAQYQSAQIFVSEAVIVEIPREFLDPYEERLPGQVLTLFIIELILLQDAALSRVGERVQIELQHAGKHRAGDELAVIERLGIEFSSAMSLWDIRNFRYRTAQALSDSIGEAFGIGRQMENFQAHRGVLEHLIHIHSARMAEAETRNLNSLLLLLACIQILPTLFVLTIRLIRQDLTVLDIGAALLTGAAILFIVLVFRWSAARERRRRARQLLAMGRAEG